MILNKMKLMRENNKHLLEVAYFIMFSMHVPNYLWEEVVLTSSYFINRMST